MPMTASLSRHHESNPVPNAARRWKQTPFYVIDAYRVARENDMGTRINTIMQTCFFAISGVLPKEQLKDLCEEDDQRFAVARIIEPSCPSRDGHELDHVGIQRPKARLLKPLEP